MPKGNPEFEKRLDFFTTHERLRELKAIALQKGHGKKISPAARMILELGIEAYKASLSREELIEYMNLVERIKVLGR